MRYLAAKTQNFDPKPLKNAGFGPETAKTKGFDPKPLKNAGFGP